MRPRKALAALLCALAGSTLFTADPLAQINDERTRVRELETEIARIKGQLIVKARVTQEREDVVAQLEHRIAAYRIEAKTREGEIAERQELTALSLGALQRFARRPPEALFVSTLAPGDAVRGTLLIAAMVPHLETEARRLETQLLALRRLEDEIAGELSRLANERKTLDGERQALDLLLERKLRTSGLGPEAIRPQVKEMAKLAEEAADLRTLLAGIATVESEPPAAAPVERSIETAAFVAPFAESRGAMLFPVRGRLVGRFGEVNDLGIKERGISLESIPGARVVAPHGGQIVFAGQFRTYGQLLILAHGGGYHTLIAGLGRIDGAVGHSVNTGEPIGRMAERGNERPILYVEMRHNGAPIDPLLWLAGL